MIHVRRAASAAIGLAVAGWVGWALLGAPQPPTRPDTPTVGGASPARPPLRRAPAPEALRDVSALLRPSAAVSIACSGAQFKLQWPGGGAPLSQCVGATQVLHNGSLLSYRVEPAQDSSRWLTIDTAGGAVVSVSVGRDAVAEWQCDGEACAGATLGVADLQGVRTIALADVRLAPTATTGTTAATADTSIRASGQFVTIADDGSSDASACSQQPVFISPLGAQTQRFCPEDGTSVYGGAGGERIYQFLGLEGPALEVALDAAGEVQRVAWGDLSCTGAACVGVLLSPGGGGASRRVEFVGTVVQQRAGSAWASLAGRLVMP